MRRFPLPIRFALALLLVAALPAGCFLDDDEEGNGPAAQFSVQDMAIANGQGSLSIADTAGGQFVIAPMSLGGAGTAFYTLSVQTAGAKSRQLTVRGDTLPIDGTTLDLAAERAMTARHGEAFTRWNRYFRDNERAIAEHLRDAAAPVHYEPVPMADSDCGGCAEGQVCDKGPDGTWACASFLALKLYDPNTGSTLNVNAPVRYVGTNLVVAVDEADMVDDATVRGLAEPFDQVVFPRAMALFGQGFDNRILWDRDRNGRVLILLTSKVSLYSGFLGLFNSQDYGIGGSWAWANIRDILYALPPGPGATLDEVAGTMAHEFQHLLQYAGRVLQTAGSGGPYNEDLWLNEGLAHLFEDLSGFGADNRASVLLYLRAPSGIRLDADDGAGNGDGRYDQPENRGFAYLLLRYLMERRGGITYGVTADALSGGGLNFVRALYSNPSVGIANLESAGATTLRAVLPDLATAIAVSNSGATGDARYNFADPFPDPITGGIIGIDLRRRWTIGGQQHAFDGPAAVSWTGGADLAEAVVARGIGFIKLSGLSGPVTLRFDGSDGADHAVRVIRVR